jgi:pimeloyl-ACP methyl ester carboxylesterase
MTTTTTRAGEPSTQVSNTGGRWRGILALALGVACLAVGIGVGLRWLQAGVVAPRSVGAMVILAAGAVLTIWGMRRITRGLRLSARILSGSLATVAVVMLVWTLTPALIATNVPPTDHESSEMGFGGREVSFETSDGVRLWGWYVPPTDGGTVVLRHGAGSTAGSVVPQASILVANGYGVLMTDARGHGRSEGDAMDFGWYGDDDIGAALTFLAGQTEVDPSRIAVVGMSMGGEEAIGAAGSDDRIAAVVAEGATARMATDKSWLEDEYGWRGWIQMRLEALQYWLTDMLTEAERPQSLAEAARVALPHPILMITAGEAPDELHAAEFIGLGNDNVKIWTVPEAGHIQGVNVSPGAWESRVVGFLDEAIGGS